MPVTTTTVTIDSTWLTNNGPAPYVLSADNTKYNLTVDVNVAPTQPTFTAVLTGGAVSSITVTGGSKFDPANPPVVTVAAPTSGVTATAHVVLSPATGLVTGVVVDTPGSGYGSTVPAVTSAGGKIWFTGEVFRFPDPDKTGRNPQNTSLVLNNHTIKVNGVTCPQKHDAELYRRTSEYTVRANYADAPHTFGGTYTDGAHQKPVIDPNAPVMGNESTWAVTK